MMSSFNIKFNINIYRGYYLDTKQNTRKYNIVPIITLERRVGKDIKDFF